MQVLLNRFAQGLTRLKTGDRESKAIHTRLSMKSKRTCPCCSYTLLRHIRWGGLYWHCSHCKQEMPAF
jgi:ribosomal protein L37AE/L43A